MSEHLREFAKHLIQREGAPVHTSVITAVFLNIGNSVNGATRDEQHQTVRLALTEDDSLQHDEDNGTWSLKSPT